MQVRRIPISWARRQAAGALANGLSLDSLYERSLIRPRFGDDRDVITPLQLTLLQTMLVLETGDGSHAMMPERLDPEIGPLGFRLLFGSASLGDGLEALSRLYRTSSRSIRFELSTRGARAFLAIRVEGDRIGSLIQEDIQLVYLHFGLTCFISRRFPVAEVVTRDASHIDLDGLHYAIGSRVRLGSCAGLGFSRTLLACPPPRPAISEFLLRPVRDGLRLGETPGAASDGVANGTFRVAAMAAERQIAPSTLRRKLALEGSGFREIRQRALLAATLDLLRSRSCGVEAIAEELGYADARSLRRFVKRATGRTPSELRADWSAAVSPALVHARLEAAMKRVAH